ncbi:Protein disulfide-isomerase erp38 [Mycena venus]|uniref:Protein disulfide-isomerase erp38 n=1 Tax=Mycena venus TaxID=2733690 RepID=A0A8H7D3M7_9AGAR|nr:Protein disulfide-isomerase erp38 [Mycena venus]
MHAYCIVVVFALLIPLSLGLVTVNAPTSAIACDPVQFTWQGGTGPWLLVTPSFHVCSILSESPPNPALENLGSSAAPPFTWVVDAKLIGTTVFLSVQDSTGDSGQSSPFTIVHPGLGSACGGSEATSGGGGEVGAIGGGANSTATGGDGSGGGNAGGETSPPPRGGSQGSSPQGGSQAPDSSSSSSAQNPPSSPTSTSSPSTSSSPSSTTSPAESPAAFNFNTASGSSSTSSTNSLSPPTFTLSDDVSGLGGQIQPASSVVQSGVSSTGITQDGASNNNNNFTKKNVMSGAIIGGIIAAAIVVLLGAFCVLRWYRRRRLNAPDTLSYPFSYTGTEASGSTPREMVGRSGYPASTFSSWGNHGDLDERAVSPSEGHSLWEPGQGTIESRYQAAFGFTPGHASSSSVDRNDPSPQAQQRFRSRGPIPKSMTDACHAGPSDSSMAIMSEQPYTAIINEGPPAHTFDEIRPQAMPSWGTAHDMMAGRHPVVAGYPPPYTSK